MEINPLNAISPIDGRYRKQVTNCSLFSEQALMRYRLQVEVEYFIALVECGLPQLTAAAKLDLDGLRSIYRDFDEAGRGSSRKRKRSRITMLKPWNII